MMTEEDRASLVAYLDGELDDEAARQVEARISTDPAVRAEIESLKRTWDLLDYLPKAEPSPNFTHRTVSRITAAHVALRTSQQRRRRWLLGTAWAAALLVALAGGYGAVLLLRRTSRPMMKSSATCACWKTASSTSRSTVSTFCGHWISRTCLATMMTPKRADRETLGPCASRGDICWCCC